MNFKKPSRPQPGQNQNSDPFEAKLAEVEAKIERMLKLLERLNGAF